MKLALFDMKLHVLRLKFKWLSLYGRLLFVLEKSFDIFFSNKLRLDLFRN